MTSEGMDDDFLTREEAKRILRRLELEAYSSVITAFRAQGDLNREKKQALTELAGHLSISTERHRAEVRRVVNDDNLNAVAECMHGFGTATEWSIEGRRLVSLTPRLVPQTVFTAKATHTANAVSHENSKLPPKRAPPQSTRDRSFSASGRVSEKLEEKVNTKESKPLEATRSISTSSTSSIKSQESNDKSKKKKKLNPTGNKVLKPNRMNLPVKSEYKSASSPNLTKHNLLSPTSMHKPISPASGQGHFHQKPLILQRSPQKSPAISRSLSADGSGSGNYLYSTKTILSSSPSAMGTLSSGADASLKQHRHVVNSRGGSAGQQPKVLVSSSNSAMVQKMKFKTPIAKSKSKPAKLKTTPGMHRPTNLGVSNLSPNADSLNVLATSTVVPMAPISPVKPVLPSGTGVATGLPSGGALSAGVLSSSIMTSGLISGGTTSSVPMTSGSTGVTQNSSCPVKVVQVQKATSNASTQSSPANPGSKPFVVVSSATPSKAGSAQRVLALGNVPISGNQQLKIASIPNVLQQSGAKIVSIAKSMPMTTGFKMIAVTTVVPGSTQVKTVYIATPIMSVTKTSTPSLQSAVSSQTTTTKLLQTLASSSSTAVRAAHTDVSLSDLAATGKPSLGVVISRASTPASTTNISSNVTATISTTTSVSHKTSTSSTTSVVVSTTISKQTVTAQNEILKNVDLQKIDNATTKLLDSEKEKNENSNSKIFDEKRKPENHSTNEKTLNSGIEKFANEGNSDSSENLVQSKAKDAPVPSKSGNSTLTASVSGPSTEGSEESILLAGEKFLAELAAKFSKNNIEQPASISSSDFVPGGDLVGSELGNENSNQQTLTKNEAQNLEFNSRIQLQHAEPSVSNVHESKVIVRKIGEEYSTPLNLCPDFECGKSETASNSYREQTDSNVYLSDGSLDSNNSKFLTSPVAKKPRNSTVNEANGKNPDSNLVKKNPTDSKVSESVKDIGNRATNQSPSMIKTPLEFPQNSAISNNIIKGNGESVTFVSNDVPRNIFASFAPTNGRAEESSGTVKSESPHSKPRSKSESLNVAPYASKESSPSQTSREVLIKQTVDKKSPSNVISSNSSHVDIKNKSPIKLSVPESQANIAESSKRKLFQDEVNLTSVTNHRLSPSNHLNAVSNSSSFNSVNATTAYTSPLNSPTLKLPNSPNPRGSFMKMPVLAYPDMQCNASTNSGIRDHAQLNNSETDFASPVFTNIIPTAGAGSITQNSHDKKPVRLSPKEGKSRGKSSSIDCKSPRDTSPKTPNELSPIQGGHEGKKPVAANSISRSGSKKRKSDASPLPALGWIKGALSLLQRVSRFRGPNKQKGEMNAASWFTRPVNPAEAPGYYNVIKKPMDFSTVRKKLEDGVYKDFTDFYSDMLLIKSNCHTYNPVDHIARKDCDLVFAFFEEECYKMLEKQRQPEDSPAKKSKLELAL